METDGHFDLKKEPDHWTSCLLASIAEGAFRHGVSRLIHHLHDKERPAVTAWHEDGLTADERLTLSITEAATIPGIGCNPSADS